MVLVGDDRQLGAIDAGGGFRGLRVRLGASVLTENRRQQAAWEREALELVRDGQVDQAVQTYREHERMVPASSKTELTLNLVREWWQAHQHAETAQRSGEPGGEAVILAWRRDEVDRLNTTCQQVMQHHGRLGTQTLQVGDRQIHAGDWVVLGRNDLRGLGVANGTRGTVTDVDPDRRSLTLKTEQGRQLTLPAAYLDGPVPNGRRAVDLAYATTGHKAQGLTRWRALVRITGQEDANWLYVQLSRAKQDTRLHTIVGPEPHPGAGELDLPDREPPDAYDQLAAALSRKGGQRLAIDTSRGLDVRATPTGELRAERDRLQADLDQAPPDRTRWLERTVQRRQQAEQQLAATEAEHPRQGRASWFGRRRDASQDHDPAARALAVPAGRADRPGRGPGAGGAAAPRGMGRGPSGGGPQLPRGDPGAGVAVPPAGCLRRAPTACLPHRHPRAHPPVRAWPASLAADGPQVEDYRQRFEIDDPDRPLGQPPTRNHDVERQQAWRQANGAIERLQSRQQRGLDRDSSSASVRSVADHDQPASRLAPARDSSPVQGPERAAG